MAGEAFEGGLEPGDTSDVEVVVEGLLDNLEESFGWVHATGVAPEKELVPASEFEIV